ncbi:sensor histidine kinase [Allostreptomyces psammosilenae]|uniref:Signal transduction histidine kinase n=1 Tax=Allostreptomyces psammosilenae TaxID=1892865 RepID=A0A853AAW2_9ACTN|nr:sensor histidine kinase [Allostreptomyces psammosilenae]NYI07648.1 signal transduction histidine kinase [Allostreptomyces psammosilenae]
MTDASPVAPGWARFYRWGPYALLGVGAVISTAAVGTLMNREEAYAAAVLAVVALGWQVAWDRPLRTLPQASRPRTCYFVGRAVLALALSWANPFFCVYALMGYFDAGRQLPAPLRRYGLLSVAVTMSGAQSGVLGPPTGAFLQWALFGALFALQSCLAIVLDRFGDQEAEKAREQRVTIEALELANARLEQALAENEALQAQLLVQAREAGIADERRRLAAEIHDTLAQGLTGIIAQLQAAADSGDPSTARAHVERAAALARHSLGEARRSVHNLAPGPLEHHTLPEALRRAVARWSTTSAARPELTVTGTAEPLHEEIEAALLRIAEEALTNVAKHADAARVGVTLSYLDDQVTLDVRDDGRGFDPDGRPPRSTAGGFGLGGMRARAERVAGRLLIESEPGAGTAVSAHVPLVRHDA